MDDGDFFCVVLWKVGLGVNILVFFVLLEKVRDYLELVKLFLFGE